MVYGFENIMTLIIARGLIIICVFFILHFLYKKFQKKKDHIYWNWGIGVFTIAPQINAILHIWTDSQVVSLVSLGIYYYMHKSLIEGKKPA